MIFSSVRIRLLGPLRQTQTRAYVADAASPGSGGWGPKSQVPASLVSGRPSRVQTASRVPRLSGACAQSRLLRHQSSWIEAPPYDLTDANLEAPLPNALGAGLLQ